MNTILSLSGLFAADGWLCQTINSASDALWTYLLIAVLLFCAVWFTIRSRGVQFRIWATQVPSGKGSCADVYEGLGAEA